MVCGYSTRLLKKQTKKTQNFVVFVILFKHCHIINTLILLFKNILFCLSYIKSCNTIR